MFRNRNSLLQDPLFLSISGQMRKNISPCGCVATVAICRIKFCCGVKNLNEIYTCTEQTLMHKKITIFWGLHSHLLAKINIYYARVFTYQHVDSWNTGEEKNNNSKLLNLFQKTPSKYYLEDSKFSHIAEHGHNICWSMNITSHIKWA